jgi:hypothetical protein
MSRRGRKTRLRQVSAICVTAGFLLAPGSDALAQQPSPKTRTSMLCKVSAGGKGFVLVTLTNLTTSTIPKGQTLFSKKSNKTIQFQAAEPIGSGGSVTNRSSASAFEAAGDCEGWY